MNSISDVKEELSMLTNFVSDDVTYLYYLLVRDGKIAEEDEVPHQIQSNNAIESLEEWFNNVGEEI